MARRSLRQARAFLKRWSHVRFVLGAQKNRGDLHTKTQRKTPENARKSRRYAHGYAHGADGR